MKKIVCFIIIALMIIVPAMSQKNIIQEINILGSKLSEAYIMRHVTFQVGDSMDSNTLEKAIAISRIKAQDDSNIDLFDVEYFQEEDGLYVDIYISDPTFKLSFGNFFAPPKAGTFVEYKNLLGEGGDVGTYLSYSRQMLQVAWNYILGSRIGISSRFGHELYNALIPNKGLSAMGTTIKAYYLFGSKSNDKIGFLTDVYGNIGDEKGNSNSVGVFYNNDLNYLLDVIGVGFKTKLSYRFFPSDIKSNIHRIDFRQRISIRPFKTDRFMIVLDGNLSIASDNLYDSTYISFSDSSGKASWQAGMFLPTVFKKFLGGILNLLVGLEPGVTVGQVGDALSADNMETALTIAPIFHIGHPVSLVFTPRFAYNITQKSWEFSFVLRQLPYTTELDMCW